MGRADSILIWLLFTFLFFLHGLPSYLTSVDDMALKSCAFCLPHAFTYCIISVADLQIWFVFSETMSDFGSFLIKSICWPFRTHCSKLEALIMRFRVVAMLIWWKPSLINGFWLLRLVNTSAFISLCPPLFLYLAHFFSILASLTIFPHSVNTLRSILEVFSFNFTLLLPHLSILLPCPLTI